MRLWRRLLRILGSTCLATLSLLLVAFLAVQIQQHIFRHRAQRLLADFHSIHLRETTWPEAQEIMQRWRRYGHADGTCNAISCGYAIVLQDPLWTLNEHASERVYSALSRMHLLSLYERLGSKGPRFSVTFIVQNGRIVRSSVGLNLDVPPQKGNEFGYRLGAGAKALSSLASHSRPRNEYVPVFGGDEQLADHPDYKAGRPGGCKICEIGEIAYTPYLPQTEVNRLTTFNLSCITTFHACKDPADIIPALEPFQLYPPAPLPPQPPEQPCSASARALGRDAQNVAEVEGLSVTRKIDPEHYFGSAPREIASVRVLRILKDPYTDHLPLIFNITPYMLPNDPDSLVSEHIKPRHRYFVLISTRGEPLDFSNAIYLQKCSVLADTPQNLTDLQTGIAQNDHLPRSEVVNFHY